jgi:hypothetical protein
MPVDEERTALSKYRLEKEETKEQLENAEKFLERIKMYIEEVY